MFSTQFSEFLQGINNDILYWITAGANLLSAEVFFIIALFIVIFGIDMKRGFILMQLFFWAYVITQILRANINIPYPFEKNSNLIKPENLDNFYTISNADLSNKKYAVNLISGFPSLNVSLTSAFWFSSYYLFRQKWIMLAGIILIFLTSLTALYSGNSFPAGVITAIALGFSIPLISNFFITTPKAVSDFVKKKRHGYNRPFRALMRIVYLFVLPLSLLFIPEVDINLTAKLMGVNLGFYVIGLKKWPKSKGSTYERMLRVLIALVVFSIFNFLNYRLASFDSVLVYFMVNLFEMFFTMIISVWICLRLNLYHQKEVI